MFRIVVGIVAAVVLLATTVWYLTRDETKTLTVAPSGLTAEDLEALLLSDDDVGEGFVEETRDPQQDEGPESVQGPSPECQAVLDQLLTAPSGELLEARFQRPSDRVVVEQAMRPVTQEGNDLGDFRRSLESCSEKAVVTDSRGVAHRRQVTTEPMSGLGEDALVVVSTITDHPELTDSFERYTVIFGRDGVRADVTVLSGVDPEASTITQDASLPADRDLARELAEELDAKIQEAMG